MDDILWRALAAGVAVALVTGPLGSVVVWRRMSYFGDALAHSALLGVALGFLMGIDLALGVAITSVAIALLLGALRRGRRLADDTLIGILAHASLSAGLVVIAFMEGLRADLLGYLFGDILAVSLPELAVIAVGGTIVLAALAFIWRDLLALTAHEDLARVDGVRVELVQIAYALLLALTIALALRVVGVLLVTALLIIPAATARRFAATPEAMAALASLAGALAITGGLAASFAWDLPAGPSVVVAASVLFALSLGVRRPAAG